MSVRYGILGLGRMGEAVARGLLRAGVSKAKIRATAVDAKEARAKTRSIGVACSVDNVALAKNSDVLFLCVKPYQGETVLRELAPHLTARHTIVSVAAGLTIRKLRAWSGGRTRVLRAMPNTPCLIGKGAIGLARGPGVSAAQARAIAKLLGQLGEVFVVPERHLDAVTGLSGSGPAYAYLLTEALAKGGALEGIPPKTALRLAALTLRGAMELLLEANVAPAALRKAVTTPGGTTEKGVQVIEKSDVSRVLIQAVRAASRRSRELGR